MIIMRELNDPRLTGMPSITRVKVSDDLSIADVYMTIMGTPGHQTAALNASDIAKKSLVSQDKAREADYAAMDPRSLVEAIYKPGRDWTPTSKLTLWLALMDSVDEQPKQLSRPSRRRSRRGVT